MNDILMIVMWGVFVFTMILTCYRIIKEMKAIKERRQLLDEIVDYLHKDIAITGKRLESHQDFMDRFCKRFENDRF